MAITIPKLNIDPEHLHTARRKLQTKTADDKITFTREEREALLTIIQLGNRKIYPSQQTISGYLYNLNEITKVNPGSHQFNRFAEKIAAFQERYCK